MSSVRTQRCLFILSGEHISLPIAELTAALEAEGYHYTIEEHRYRMCILEVDPLGAARATRRSALVNHAQQILFEVSMEQEEIFQAMKDIDIQKVMQPNLRFAVRITRLQREAKAVDVEQLEREIGSQIWNQMGGEVIVDLKQPDVLFLGVIVKERFFFGLFLASRDRHWFSIRRGPRRPFFVPSAIHPKTARAMVNLSRAARGNCFLDPFCGTGGLLLEAAGVGCLPVGLDIDLDILAGCHQNLSHFQVPFYASCTDARMPPLRSHGVDVIATDPPYGRTSSTKGAEVVRLIKSSLLPLAEILKPGGHLCFAVPLKYYNEDMFSPTDFKIVETHTMRIHRSLSRHIVVLKRK